MTYTLLMTWTIEFTSKARKQVSKLNKQVYNALRLLEVYYVGTHEKAPY